MIMPTCNPMKHPILHKVALTTVALLASLALSARGGPASLSTARQTHGSSNTKSFHQLLFPASTYMIDDGTAEDAIGLTLGGDVIALNEFDVLPGADQISSVSIAWGTAAFPDPSLNNLIYSAIVWQDDSGIGNPAGGTHVVARVDGLHVMNAGTDTFITTPMPTGACVTGKFYVGFLVTHQGGQFPSAFDETNPTFSNRSFIAGGAAGTGDVDDLNNNDLPVAPIESFALIGNWLVRADGTSCTGGGDLTLTSAASVKRGFAVDLPLTGASGVEPRSGGANGKYTVRMTFNNSITGVSGATTSCGAIKSVSVDSGDNHNVNVQLNGVPVGCNGSDVTVSAIGITDDMGNALGSASAKLGLLVGDVDGDRTVTTHDVRTIKGNRGMRTDSTNFRSDVNDSGHIDNSDSRLATGQVGTHLP